MAYFSRALVLFVLLLLPPVVSAPAHADPVIQVPDDNVEMNAAIARARSSLTEFWAALENPPADTDRYALKVRITDSHGSEHFWTNQVVRDRGRIYGEIANAPEIVSSVVFGQRIEIRESDISDWTFHRSGKIVGNETLRALLRYMPAEDAAKYRAQFETP